MIKHIVIVTSYYAPAWAYGGPPVVLSTLAKELVRQGYKVSVITTDVLDEKRNKVLEERIDGVDVYRYPTISNTLAYRFKFFYSPTANRASNIVKTGDYILFSDLRSIFNLQLYNLVSHDNVSYGIFPFGQVSYDQGVKKVIKRIFDTWWVRDFVNGASHVFCQTEHERKGVCKHFGIKTSKAKLLYLPVQLPKKIDYKVMRKDKREKMILFVGRLNQLKGVDLLIKSAIPIIKKDLHVRLVIVGRDDGEEGNLRELIPDDLKNRIMFTGPLYGKDVENLYKKAWCFAITPRFYEETSMAALEALSHGVPVVATREADVPHLEEYKAGFIVDNKPEVIGQAIQRVLDWQVNDPHVVRKRTISFVKDKFFSSHIAKQLIVYLKNV